MKFNYWVQFAKLNAMWYFCGAEDFFFFFFGCAWLGNSSQGLLLHIPIPICQSEDFYCILDVSWDLVEKIFRAFFGVYRPRIRKKCPFIEFDSSHLYASFGTFCVQIFQLFKAQSDFKLSEKFELNVIFQKHPFYRFQTFFKDPLCLEKLTNLDYVHIETNQENLSFDAHSYNT